MRSRLTRLALLALVGGCNLTRPDEPLAQVSSNHFDVQGGQVARSPGSLKQSDQATCMRVDTIGRKVAKANPQMGLNPQFAAAGSASPEIFHLGESLIVVTDTLVKQCKSDAELAAVLAFEMGRIVADRESKVRPEVRDPDRAPPIRVPIGNAGNFSSPDLTPLAEAARFEQERPRRRGPLPRPDPYHLARLYLEKSGYQSSDLAAVEPLLQQADRNTSFEKQMKGQPSGGGWTR